MNLQLSPGTRKVALVAHVWSVGAWIGLDAAKSLLIAVGLLGGDRGAVALAYRALGTFLGAPLIVASTAALITGLLLGVGTRWGLLSYWWVAAKLVITLVLVTLVCTVLAPMLPAVAAYGDALAAGAVSAPADVTDLVYPAIVAPLSLLTTTLLSVVKPWGRIRRGAAQPAQRRVRR
ncbi:hypothetical protein SAMN05443637_101210 [Pseudonocardia thermophila]|uniref:DUF2269 domain-containing protein n=1 Tax=Pseudonocardia thermophila TaxID=1848 RepID=A0A1M6NEL3_PSETH|nr:hypothetical protein [Pseudonocardia thermophila]SHJ94117.1 hypothetical protein SAMN05443637_101210 [Pseudonocardia thermophila]